MTVLDAPMKPAEYLDEVDWLLRGGVSPELVAQQLNMKPSRIAMAARRCGRHDLYAPFNLLQARERDEARR